MKRLLVLLLVLAGGLAAAALTVPTNAADVNGTAISQQSLNSDVDARSPAARDYQCYLNSQAYLGSSGAQQLPAGGRGRPEPGSGSIPTATSAFVATYLDTEIGHQLVAKLAAQRRPAADGQAKWTPPAPSCPTQITQTMSEVSQVPQPPRHLRPGRPP